MGNSTSKKKSENIDCKKKIQKKSFIWIYNDKKLNTPQALGQLKLDLEISHENLDISLISCKDEAINYKDRVILFYYFAGGRNSSIEIVSKVQAIRKENKDIRINVVILQDSLINKQTLDLSQAELKDDPQIFSIFSNQSSEELSLALKFDKPRSWTQERYSKVVTNYENLLKYMKSIL